MNTRLNITILTAIVAILSGCVTQPRGPAYGHEDVFRQQIAESVLVKQWHYKVQDIRLSDDYQRALVVFLTKRGQPKEVILKNDGFRRYTGVTSITNDEMAFGSNEFPHPEVITVTLPRK